MKQEGVKYFHQLRKSVNAIRPRKQRDDMSDPYDLYDESYWDSVRAKGRPQNAGSKDTSEGRGDSPPDDSTEKRATHPRRGRPKKGTKRGPNRRRGRTQNKKPLAKILA